ncbi:MAG: sulfotransferase family 2 domain-containing protein [Pikeienuella sp.]
MTAARAHTMAPIDKATRQAAFGDTWRAYGPLFADRPQARYLLNTIATPVSRRWSFIANGKTGTTAALRALFEIEFGTALSVTLTDPDDLNDDPAPHRLYQTGVLSVLMAQGASLVSIENALRLTTVRHPGRRAASAFRYICRADEVGHRAFLRERMVMNAYGLDWAQDRFVVRGFQKFLEITRDQLCNEKNGLSVNLHWRPQVLNIVPAAYRPHVVGRMEALDVFTSEVAARLDRPSPRLAVSNRQPAYDADVLLADPTCARLIREIYAADFEEFGYDD